MRGRGHRACEKLIVSRRLSVMFMPAMMASYFLALERRDDAVPVLGDDLALDLHAGAEVVGEVDLEAFELAAGAGEVPRTHRRPRVAILTVFSWAAAPPMAKVRACAGRDPEP